MKTNELAWSDPEAPWFQVVQQEALTRLLIEKGIFSKEELWEMVKVVNQKTKRNK
jgi:hypothetical protein